MHDIVGWIRLLLGFTVQHPMDGTMAPVFHGVGDLVGQQSLPRLRLGFSTLSREHVPADGERFRWEVARSQGTSQLYCMGKLMR